MSSTTSTADVLARLRDEAIRQACYDEALSQRWNEHRRTGLTDAQLSEAIDALHFGNGSMCAPGRMAVAYRGGSKPALYLNACWAHDQARPFDPEYGPVEKLSGVRLLREVRRVLRIPYLAGDGVAVVQAALFGAAS